MASKAEENMELVRAHVFSLLGAPDEGILATRTSPMGYDRINDYISKNLPDSATEKLRAFYAQAIRNGEREEFEKGLYSLMFMYGLGRVGYGKLDGLVGDSRNAVEFMAGAEEAAGLAERKTGIAVSFPPHETRVAAGRPAAEQVETIRGEPAPGRKAESTRRQAAPPAAEQVEIRQAEAQVAGAPRRAEQRETPGAAAREEQRARAAAARQEEARPEDRTPVGFAKLLGIKELESIEAMPAEGSGLSRLTARKPPFGQITGDAEGAVFITEDRPGKTRSFYVEWWHPHHDRDTFNIKVTQPEKNEQGYYNAATYQLTRKGKEFEVTKLAQQGSTVPLDLNIVAGKGDNQVAYEVRNGSVSVAAVEHIDCTKLLGMDVLQSIHVTRSGESGLQPLKASPPPFGRMRTDSEGSVFIRENVPGPGKSYYMEYDRNPNDRNQYFVTLVNPNEKTDGKTYDYTRYLLTKRRDGFDLEKVREYGKPIPLDLSIVAGKGDRQTAFEVSRGEIEKFAMVEGQRKKLPG